MNTSILRRILGVAKRAAKFQSSYPEYYRSDIGRKVDETSCLPAAYSSVKLTRTEKEEIKKLWGAIIPGPIKRADIFYRMIKGIGEFDPRYLPSSFYYPYILFALSPEKYARSLDDKSLMPVLFPEIEQPEQICLKYSRVADQFGRDFVYNIFSLHSA